MTSPIKDSATAGSSSLSNLDSLIGQLLLRWQEARDEGKDLTPEELCSECPALSGQIREGIEALKRLAAVLQPKLERMKYPFLTPPTGPAELGRLGPYRVLELLGAGGMGLVFRAEDDRLHRLVALKVMKPETLTSTETVQRFLREARTLALVESDHIVTIFQVDECHGTPFIAMQLLRGETLNQRLRRAVRLPVQAAMTLGRQLALGLAAVHDRGLVHRDLKPDNIWLQAGSDLAKLLDFGLAREIRSPEPITVQGFVVGTPAFMSPEQARGQDVDARSDLFSLGCVLYQSITGLSPFDRRDFLGTLRAVESETPANPASLVPEVPASLDTLIVKLLTKERAGRPASAADVARLLEILEKEIVSAGNTQEKETVSAHALTQRVAPAARHRYSFWLAGGFAIVLLAAFTGALSFPALRAIWERPADISDGNKEDTEEGSRDSPLSTNLAKGTTDKKPILPAKPDALPDPRSLVGHTKPIMSVAFSADGKRLYSVGEDRTLRTWSIEGGDEIKDERNNRIWDSRIALSSDGELSASAYGNGLTLYDRKPRKELKNIFMVLGFPALMKFSGDGRRLIVSSRQGEGEFLALAKVWDFHKDKVYTFEGHYGVINDMPSCVDLSFDGSVGLSYARDGLRLFNVQAGKEIQYWKLSSITAAALDSKATSVFVGNVFGAIDRYDAKSGKSLASFEGHRKAISTMLLSPDGRRLLTGGEDKTLRLWDLSSGKELQRFEKHTARITCAAFSPDGSAVASGDAEKNLWWWPIPK